MAVEMECPVCEAEIPLDNKEAPGDLIQCSYCKETFKIVNVKNKGWILSQEFEE